jgi:transposase-like protein
MRQSQGLNNQAESENAPIRNQNNHMDENRQEINYFTR